MLHSFVTCCNSFRVVLSCLRFLLIELSVSSSTGLLADPISSLSLPCFSNREQNSVVFSISACEVPYCGYFSLQVKPHGIGKGVTVAHILRCVLGHARSVRTWFVGFEAE